MASKTLERREPLSQPHLLAAQLLESSASAYAACAASLLLERHPEFGERFAPSALRDWQTSLTQRVLELSAALGAAEPKLFVTRIQWVEKAIRARSLAAEDLRRSLDCLREVLRDELPETVRAEADDYLDHALRALDTTPPPALDTAPEAALDAAQAHGRLALRYLQAVLEGRARQAIDLVASAIDGGLTFRDAYLEVLLPVQREVGEMWHLGEIGVAEEHFVTATTERALAVLAQRAECQPDNGKTVVAAAVDGNQHALAVRAVADFFDLAGWRTVVLGADVPPGDIVAAVQAFDADLVLLSAMLTTQLKAMRRSVDALRQLENRPLRILVGGLAFADAPDLWRGLGADGHAATADEAVELGARLVGLTTPHP